MISLLLTAALAGPCDLDTDGMVMGPTIAVMHDGALGNPRRTCARSELGVAIDGRATIDSANFYGYLTGGLSLDGGWAPNKNLEVFGRLELVRFDMAVATITSTNLGLGHLSAGVAYNRELHNNVATGIRFRTVLPTATGLYSVSQPLSFDLAWSHVWAPLDWLWIHQELTGIVTANLGRNTARAGGAFNLGLETRVHRTFGLVFDMDAGFGLDAPLDHFTVGGGLRFSDGKRFGFELGARIPVAGRARELAMLSLRASSRFGKVQQGPSAR